MILKKNTRKLDTLTALLHLCHKLGVMIVIEGIEHISQHNLIKGFNITNILVQGYLYAKPSAIKDKNFCTSTYFSK